MLKICIAVWIAATSVLFYYLTDSIGWSIATGLSMLVAAIYAWNTSGGKAPEVTSDPLPTFIPASMDPYDAAERRHREKLLKKAEPVIDEDGEVLPPPPNVGEDGIPYRGPRYFDSNIKG